MVTEDPFVSVPDLPVGCLNLQSTKVRGDGIAATIGEMGWGDGKKKTKIWLENEEEESS